MTAMSSMHSTMCGRRSETSMPLFPKRRYVRFVPSGRASLNMNWYLASLAEFGGPLLTAELVEQRLRIEPFRCGWAQRP